MKIISREEYNKLKEHQSILSEIKGYLLTLSTISDGDIPKVMNNINLYHIYDLIGMNYKINTEPNLPEDCGKRIRPYDLPNYSGKIIYVCINNVIVPMIVTEDGETVQEEYSTSGYSIKCNIITGFYEKLR